MSEKKRHKRQTGKIPTLSRGCQQLVPCLLSQRFYLLASVRCVECVAVGGLHWRVLCECVCTVTPVPLSFTSVNSANQRGEHGQSLAAVPGVCTCWASFLPFAFQTSCQGICQLLVNPHACVCCHLGGQSPMLTLCLLLFYKSKGV